MCDAATPQIDPQDLTIAEQANRIAELSKLVAEVTQENQQLREENKQIKDLKERIERLEALLASKVDTKSSKKPVFTENYSLERNKLGNQDSDKKPPKKSTGRKPREAKEHLVSDTIEVFPPDIDRSQCIHHRFQSAWRIVDGKAVYLRYDIRDLADSTNLPLPPGIRNSRSEFGMEVILILSFGPLTAGVTYDFWLVGRNSQGEGPQSNHVTHVAT